ncbi:hypothetical protein HPULCUR_010587 [Helicostylum pulchrum]|uniref:Transposase (putative) YhgA-like domain-containing protein n=1 Tax=Helicostylum pulchrum TaxID=562976 RepID=A0ABP9YDP2_9FUNG
MAIRKVFLQIKLKFTTRVSVKKKLADPPARSLSLELPYRHRPGTDLMSKHVLLDPAIINSVVETVVGKKAKDNYTPWPTEWINNTKSDILYVAKNFTNDNSFPPVLVEIQHMVDTDFIIRLMDYSISVYQRSAAIMSEAFETLSEEVSGMKMWPKTKKVLEDAKWLS